MTQRLQDRRVSGDDISQLSVQDWLRTSLPELGSMQSQQGADQAADNLSVSNAVSSLRAVGDANWPDIVARTSSLMRLMLTSHLFAAEDAATQDQTLHAIERLSKRSRLSEVVVATTLLDLMQPSEASASETTVAHHWLRGKGLPALLVRLNVRPQWGLSGSGWTARPGTANLSGPVAGHTVFDRLVADASTGRPICRLSLPVAPWGGVAGPGLSGVGGPGGGAQPFDQ
jgi:cyclic beta-1,2-glucan synthetase